jgi:hypothetical protein|tara:strand:+ start:2146 stop:2394 length:249 start_codon:yes stop_codon:yes gene_type:complete
MSDPSIHAHTAKEYRSLVPRIDKLAHLNQRLVAQDRAEAMLRTHDFALLTDRGRTLEKYSAGLAVKAHHRYDFVAEHVAGRE